MIHSYKIVRPTRTRYGAQTLGSLTLDEERRFILHQPGLTPRHYPFSALQNAAWLADDGLASLPDRPWPFFITFFLALSIIGNICAIILGGYTINLFMTLFATLGATAYIVFAPTHYLRLTFNDGTHLIIKTTLAFADTLRDHSYKTYTAIPGWRKYKKTGRMRIDTHAHFLIQEEGNEDHRYPLTALRQVQWTYWHD